MKIVKATAESKNVVNGFVKDAIEAGFRPEALDPKRETRIYWNPRVVDWFDYMTRSAVDVYLVYDRVVGEDGSEPVYTLPHVGEDMLVAVIAVDTENVSEVQNTLYSPARETCLYVAQEYRYAVSIMLMLKDFVEYVVRNGIPYKCLWLTQAREGGGECSDMCNAVCSSDLATGYIQLHKCDGVADERCRAGYCIDLRAAHYLMSVIKKMELEEG